MTLQVYSAFAFSQYSRLFLTWALTKIRTYALISRVRHGTTAKGRIRRAASSAGAEARRRRAQSENTRRKMRMSRSYEGTLAAKEHNERKDKSRCAFLPCDPCVLLRQIHTRLRLRRSARFLSANLSAVPTAIDPAEAQGPARAAVLAAVEDCGIESREAALSPHAPIPLNLYQSGGLFYFRIATQASSARLVHFRGNSTQLPFHEQVTHRNELLSINPNQA